MMGPSKLDRVLLALVIAQVAVQTGDAAVILNGETSAEAAFVNGDTFVFTLSVTSDAGTIGGFDGALDPATSLAFRAAPGSFLRQSAFPVPTPTQDLNPVIPDENIDTQFLFLNNEVIAARAPFESATTLGGGFAFADQTKSTRNILQLAVPSAPGITLNYSFVISEVLPGGAINLQTITGAYIPPPPPSEPSSVVLGSLAAVIGLTVSRRRRLGHRVARDAP